MHPVTVGARSRARTPGHARAATARPRRNNGDAGMKGSFAGVVLIVLGTLFLAQNFGLLELKPYWKFWPVILLVVGLWLIVGRRR